MTRRTNMVQRITDLLSTQREPIPTRLIAAMFPAKEYRAVKAALSRMSRPGGPLLRYTGRGPGYLYALAHVIPAWAIPQGETRDRIALRELVAALTTHTRVLPPAIASAMRTAVTALESSDTENLIAARVNRADYPYRRDQHA
jgi:hypothetical protein